MSKAYHRRESSQRPTNAPQRLRRRIVVIGGVLALAFLGLTAKAGRLTLVFGSDLRALAQDQYLRSTVLAAPRGSIIDRQGRLLAASAASWSVGVRPATIIDKPAATAALCTALDVTPAQVKAALDSDANFVWLKRKVAREVADDVRTLGIPGVELRQESRRFYPQKELLGQVFGGVDIDGNARGGLEKSLDDVLRGRSARVPTLTDNKGDRIALSRDLDVMALDGDTVTLTIDSRVQNIAEEALIQTLRDRGAKAAWAIVLDAKTAEVLALANAPAYNPNAPATNSANQKNRALADAFEPASIFKLATFAAALDAGVVTPSDSLFCENGVMQLGRHTIHDTHKAGWLTARQVFQVSSNIGTLKIAQRLGEDNLKDALVRYGFGERLGIGLSEEAPGRLPREQRWGDVRTATVSFGHGLTVSALQIVSLAQAIANGGVRITPKLVARVTSTNGEFDSPATAGQSERLFSATTNAVLVDLMKGVIEKGGTGTLAAIAGVVVAGKTGTAEKVDPITKRYSNQLHLSSFVGFAPADAPEVVAIVVVDEPQGDGFGGTVAAPAWRHIVQSVLVQRGVLSASVANVAVAADGNDDDSAEGSGVDGSVSLPAERGVAPNFKGMAAREAFKTAQRAGVEIAIEGSGVVVAQTPAGGAGLPAGAAVTLTLADSAALAALGPP